MCSWKEMVIYIGVALYVGALAGWIWGYRQAYKRATAQLDKFVEDVRRKYDV